MNLQGFSVRHLAVLDILFTERHVGRAADRLGLSQPAVSNTLGWLRIHFGDPLLVRSGGTLRLTPFAERMREPVRRLLVDFRSVATNRPIFDPATATNRFRIVMSHYIGVVLLPSLLSLFSSLAPYAQLEVARIDGDINEFRRGEVDLVIVPGERMFPYDTYEPLFTDIWVCVGAADKWGKADGLDLDQYLATRHILPDQPQSLVTDLQHLGIEREIAATVPYALLMRTLRGTGLLATVPEKFALAEPQQDDFTILPLPYDARPIAMHQQWHPETSDDASILWLRSIVRRAVVRAGIDLIAIS